MLLYIIRHGEPDYSTDSLTERGIIEAEAVGKRLAVSNIDEIYSSPMGRAQQTAAPLCKRINKEATILPWLHELGEEKITTLSSGERLSIASVPNYIYREGENNNIGFDGYQNVTGFCTSEFKTAFDYVAKNLNEFLATFGYEKSGGIFRITNPNEKRIALFCHGVLSRCLISELLHIPPHITFAGFGYSYTGVSVIEFRNYEAGFTVPRCLSYCDLSHLFADGLQVNYNKRIFGI